MRFVMAIVAFVVAAALVVLGFAQRTVLLGPDSISETVTTNAAPITLIGGDALSAFDGKQSVLLTGSGTVFAAYGRTADVLAWVGDASHNVVTVDTETGELVSEDVAGIEDEVPNPAGSDLWLEEFTQESWLRFSMSVTSDYTVLIASDGTDPAPSTIQISWPLSNATPWAGPLILGGILVGLIGVGLYLWALHHLRRSRGPRRKTPKLPKPPPALKYKPAQNSIEAAPERGRRSAKRSFTAIAMLGVSTVLLAGCSADYWPDMDDTAAVSPTETDAPAELTDGMFPPAVSVPQLGGIVARVASVINEADESGNAELLATRAAGSALELRAANYTIRTRDSAVPALAPIPTSKPTTILPEATDSWPRTVMAVVAEADPTLPQLMLVLVQETPRSNYLMHYAISLSNQQEIPFAPATVGAPAVKAESLFTVIPPGQVSPEYGDIMLVGEASVYWDVFETANDTLLTQFGLPYKTQAAATLPAEATIAFGKAEQTGEVLSLATSENGAIVATNVNEFENVTPKETGGTVSPKGQVKALSAVESTKTGVQAVYGYQLLFYVPPVADGGQVVLLGYTQGLIAAKGL